MSDLDTEIVSSTSAHESQNNNDYSSNADVKNKNGHEVTELLGFPQKDSHQVEMLIRQRSPVLFENDVGAMVNKSHSLSEILKRSVNESDNDCVICPPFQGSPDSTQHTMSSHETDFSRNDYLADQEGRQDHGFRKVSFPDTNSHRSKGQISIGIPLESMVKECQHPDNVMQACESDVILPRRLTEPPKNRSETLGRIRSKDNDNVKFRPSIEVKNGVCSLNEITLTLNNTTNDQTNISMSTMKQQNESQRKHKFSRWTLSKETEVCKCT